MGVRERQLVIVLVDLANFSPAVRGMDAVGIADLLARYYAEVDEVVPAAGGRVVKYMGDGCLCVFPVERAADAVEAVIALDARVGALAAELDLPMEMGANLHLSTVAEGEFGAEGRYDVMGVGIIHTFKMGAGTGIRISEPVYRKLPSHTRRAWTKQQPPATYTWAAT